MNDSLTAHGLISVRAGKGTPTKWLVGELVYAALGPKRALGLAQICGNIRHHGVTPLLTPLTVLIGFALCKLLFVCKSIANQT